eukprot:7350950-Prymnesium_polylepis.1
MALLYVLEGRHQLQSIIFAKQARLLELLTQCTVSHLLAPTLSRSMLNEPFTQRAYNRTKPDPDGRLVRRLQTPHGLVGSERNCEVFSDLHVPRAGPRLAASRIRIGHIALRIIHQRSSLACNCCIQS